MSFNPSSIPEIEREIKEGIKEGIEGKSSNLISVVIDRIFTSRFIRLNSLNEEIEGEKLENILRRFRRGFCRIFENDPISEILKRIRIYAEDNKYEREVQIKNISSLLEEIQKRVLKIRIASEIEIRLGEGIEYDKISNRWILVNRCIISNTPANNEWMNQLSKTDCNTNCKDICDINRSESKSDSGYSGSCNSDVEGVEETDHINQEVVDSLPTNGQDNLDDLDDLLDRMDEMERLASTGNDTLDSTNGLSSMDALSRIVCFYGLDGEIGYGQPDLSLGCLIDSKREYMMRMADISNYTDKRASYKDRVSLSELYSTFGRIYLIDFFLAVSSIRRNKFIRAARKSIFIAESFKFPIDNSSNGKDEIAIYNSLLENKESILRETDLFIYLFELIEYLDRLDELDGVTDYELDVLDGVAELFESAESADVSVSDLTMNKGRRDGLLTDDEFINIFRIFMSDDLSSLSELDDLFELYSNKDRIEDEINKKEYLEVVEGEMGSRWSDDEMERGKKVLEGIKNRRSQFNKEIEEEVNKNNKKIDLIKIVSYYKREGKSRMRELEGVQREYLVSKLEGEIEKGGNRRRMIIRRIIRDIEGIDREIRKREGIKEREKREKERRDGLLTGECTVDVVSYFCEMDESTGLDGLYKCDLSGLDGEMGYGWSSKESMYYILILLGVVFTVVLMASISMRYKQFYI